MMKFIFNNKGFSLVEIIVSLGVLGATVFLGTMALKNISVTEKEVRNDTTLDNTVHSLVGAIRSNILMQKVNFNAQTFLETTSVDKVKEILPLAWNHSIIVPKEECPDCPGRIGYVVTPPNETIYRGLYQVTIRVTHEQLFPGSYKTYTFLVNGK